MAEKKILIVVFAIAMIALAGCSSNDGSSTPTAIDTAPPAVPTDVTGEPWNSQVVVSWAPNTTDTDFAGYKVYRTQGARTASLVDTPIAQNMYLDTHPAAGNNTYRVTAVDATGNESAYTSVDVYLESQNNEYHPDAP